MAISSGNWQTCQGSLTCCPFYGVPKQSWKLFVSKIFQSYRLTLNHTCNQYKFLTIFLFSASRTKPGELIWPCELPRSAKCSVNRIFCTTLETIKLSGDPKTKLAEVFTHLVLAVIILKQGGYVLTSRSNERLK